jgi:anti-sigma factor RsiW
MTCEQAIEILPWYLNGTLEAKEKEEVRHHLATCETCRRALAETREAWRTFDQHLPSEALVALAWGEAPAGIDPALAERHLAACPQCAAELELARTSRHLEEDNRIALFPAKPAAAPSREIRRDGEDGETRTWRHAALAASLAAMVSFGGWIYTAVQGDPSGEPAQVAQATEPSLNIPILNLVPNETERSGEGEAKEISTDVPAPLMLSPDLDADTYERYEIEIRKQGEEKPRFRSQGLLLVQDGYDSYFSLSIPAGFLEPGRYEIRLFGLRDGQRGERVGVYEVTAR